MIDYAATVVMMVINSIVHPLVNVKLLCGCNLGDILGPVGSLIGVRSSVYRSAIIR